MSLEELMAQSVMAEELSASLIARYPLRDYELKELDEEPYVVICGLVATALEKGDILPDEVEKALYLAQAGMFLKSSEYLAQRLIAYRAEHFAAA